MPSSIGIVSARAWLCTKITEDDAVAVASRWPPLPFTLAQLLLTSVRIRTRYPAECRRGGEALTRAAGQATGHASSRQPLGRQRRCTPGAGIIWLLPMVLACSGGQGHGTATTGHTDGGSEVA